MASTADIRDGVVLLIDGQLWNVIEFQHVKPGKGGAFVRTKLKNVVTGKVVDRTYNAGAKIDIENVDRRDYQYLYKDGEDFVFMDGETYSSCRSRRASSATRRTTCSRTSRRRSRSTTTAALRRAARLRRARGHLHRARPAGRPLERGHEARDPRDRGARSRCRCSSRGHEGQGRHPHGRLPRSRLLAVSARSKARKRALDMLFAADVRGETQEQSLEAEALRAAARPNAPPAGPTPARSCRASSITARRSTA